MMTDREKLLLEALKEVVRFTAAMQQTFMLAIEDFEETSVPEHLLEAIAQVANGGANSIDEATRIMRAYYTQVKGGHNDRNNKEGQG